MPQIIMAAVAFLISALRQYLPGIVGRVLLALGIGFVTNQLAMPSLKAYLEGRVGGLPGVLSAYFGATGFGIACTIILSAYLAGRAQKLILSKISPT